MTSIMICPNSRKIDILSRLSSNKSFHDYKFMTKDDYFNNYFYTYDDKTIFYLMNKYNYHIDVCKQYLNSLYPIDINKKYKNKKLIFLQDLKKELISLGLLVFNKNFSSYIKFKNIEIVDYYDLELYEEQALNYHADFFDSVLDTEVYEFLRIEDEVNFVCIEIRKLLDNGIDINKIFLTNVDSEYYFLLKEMFSYYQIPINIPFKNSIYGTKIVNDYLNTLCIDLDNVDGLEINKKLVSIEEELIEIDRSSVWYKELLVDKIKHTYLNNSKLENAVNIKNMYETKFDDDQYVFVLGFNQDIVPRLYKDDQFITDKMKNEVDLYTTEYKNIRATAVSIHLLNRIKNKTISYKLSTPFQKYYPSNLISEFDLTVIKDYFDNYNYSNIYNKIRLAEKLDKYNLYGEETAYLKELNSHYNILYNTYSNDYTGIDNDLYLKNISYPLNLSYTSLNTYNECGFKYYLNYVLKLDSYEESFAAFIGLMYHHILSLYKKTNFDLEIEYHKYLEKRDLTFKEKILLIKIKKDLEKLLKEVRKQDLITGYDDALYECKLEAPIREDISVNLIGYVDKIMFYKKIEDTYLSIVDYKSGSIDTHIEPLKYGLHMQLPVYLYLIHKARSFSNPIFTGIYYQNILFNYPTWKDNIDAELNNRYLLNGYSTDNLSVLERFDPTYMDSNYIKNMKYSEDKGFSRYAKIISDDTLFNLIKYTENEIKKTTDNIINSNFSINPKVYDKENISCKHCVYKDICYTTAKDLVYLEKVNDLSFLGGDVCGLD